jgi:hypothetical protein
LSGWELLTGEPFETTPLEGVTATLETIIRATEKDEARAALLLGLELIEGEAEAKA